MSSDLERYIIDHISSEDPVLTELDRQTHLRVIQPRMLSGHLQGRLLEMFTAMVRPQYVLELGTFTGYSALSMAAGARSKGQARRQRPQRMQAVSFTGFDSASLKAMTALLFFRTGYSSV